MAEVSYLQPHENDDEDLLSFDCPSPDSHHHHSILFHRQNQANFVIDMFHQSVEQSHSQSFPDSYRTNEELTENDLRTFGSAYVGNINNNNNNNGDDNLGFMYSDCWDEFFSSQTTTIMNPFNQPDPNSNPSSNPDPIPDLEWEEIDNHEANPDQVQANGLEWEVLLNAHNLEPNLSEFSDYNYADNEMLFGQFLDNESSYSGRPPASTTVVENLSSVVITEEDYESNKTVCAVCKDEIGVGLTAKRLPCGHVYHGECIVPWLGIRNTCPVCRHELLTDDVGYERWKAERASSGRD